MHIGTDQATTPHSEAWCFWSTTDSIKREVPSVMAILETAISVVFYWLIALRTGILPPAINQRCRCASSFAQIRSLRKSGFEFIYEGRAKYLEPFNG
jgi:hypothetical protein